MARRKNAPESIRVKHGLSERLRLLRTEFYGDRGGPDLARTLGIPVRTWYNYENGVTVPAEIILRVIELTSVEAIWLLRGDGSKFRSNGGNPSSTSLQAASDGLAASSVTDLLRVALERLEEEERTTTDFSFAPPTTSRRVEADRDPIEWDRTEPDSLDRPLAGIARYDAAQAEWLESRRDFQNLRVADDSMAPIVAEGAQVTYADAEPASESFHEKLVVARVDGQPIVRWFQHCGRFALLRAENPNALPPTILVELDRENEHQVESFHRVLWISTPH